MSGTVAYLLRSRLRVDWRSILLTTLVAGVSLGLSLATLTAARSAAGAHQRYFESVRAYDYSTGFSPDLVGAPMDDLVGDVVDLEAYEQVVGFVMQIEGVERTDIPFQLGPLDEAVDLERPTVLAGRLASAADEVVVNAEAAERTGLGPGDRVTAHLETFDPETFAFVPDPTDLSLVVTGVVRMPDEFVVDPFREAGVLLPSSAFVHHHLDSRAYGNLWVRLRPGSDGSGIRDALASVGLAFDEDRTQERDRVWDSVQPMVSVAALAGGLVLAVTTVLLAQAQLRIRARGQDEERVLSSLGCGVSTRRAVRLAIAGLLAGGILAVGVVTTVSGSSFMSLGPYAEVDPQRGARLDPLVVLLGVLPVLVAVVGVAAIAPASRVGQGGSPVGLPFAGLPLPLRLGIDWSFDLRRRGDRSLLAALPGLVTALALVVAAVVFVRSLGELGDQPRWYGAPWEAVGRVPFGQIEQASIDAVAADPDVDGYAMVAIEGGLLNGRPMPLLEVTRGHGEQQWPVVVEGREPAGSGEVLVGEDALRRLDLDLGDRITLQAQSALDETKGPPPPFEAEIVGAAVFPNIGSRGIDGPRLSTGVAVAAAALPGGAEDTGTMLLVDLRDGVDPARWTAGRALVSEGSAFSADWLLDFEPVEIEQASGAVSVIWWTVVVLSGAALAMMSHGLATTVRRRSRDYALLRSLGMSSRQLAATVVTQGFSALAVAAVAALALGIAAGRMAWLAFAEDLGVMPRATVPASPLVGGVVAAIVATAIALVPWARRAQRVPAAELLGAD